MRDAARWLSLSALIIVLDQATKVWANAHLSPEPWAVFPGFNLLLAYNPGAAFSFLASEGGWQKGLFSVLAVVVAAVIVRLLARHARERAFCFALSLVLGGALGNLIDRLRLGHVIDFLDFYWRGHHWPAFNVADIGVTTGAALLVWLEWRKDGKR